ncbi:hypothetical protein QTI51_36735 [Variovorax sp. J22G73]|uniref:hypothetical protein n=1 Tax=unclassified Variovorax TaxID=663243 RepID=UPI002575A3BC|nr:MULTISPECIES: hypothetical protein [unclassified Variovorax]MDM0010543.1 hypothetical protein [Variovorax sp. J22R203]MDM0102875.1 hypothetical protein [Variovorax sp. J22G73]
MITQKYQPGFVLAKMRFHGLSEDGEFNVRMIELPRDFGIAIVQTRDRGTDVERTYLMLDRGMLHELLVDESHEVMDITIARRVGQDEWGWNPESVQQAWLCKPSGATGANPWRVVLQAEDGSIDNEDLEFLSEALERRIQWIRPELPVL